MSDDECRTFSLSAEQANFIDGLVASGSYTSGNEVVEAGLRALQERDAVPETWLVDDVAPVYDAMKADPARGLSAEAVFAEVRARQASRKSGV